MANKNKRIGIVANNTNSSIAVTHAYYNFLSAYGRVDIINPYVDEVVPGLDLLVLPGGSDVNSLRYGEVPHPTTRFHNAALEFFDVVVLPKYIEEGIPILGICRGMQTLNVYFGGALDQDIKGVNYSNKSRSDLVDSLVFFRNDFNESLYLPTYFYNGIVVKGKANKTQYYQVNSLHHQGILSQIKPGDKPTMIFPKLAKPLIPLAYERYTKNLEAFVHENGQIVGLQWHPEELNAPHYAHKIITKLI